MDSITGKKDLKRQAVPDPAKTSPSDDDSDSDNKENAKWPIITGYGAYISSMPNIVNGKQWMTAMENRKALADDIAQTCVRLNTSGKLSKLGFIRSATVEGKKITTIHEETLAISADNLKKTLIEPVTFRWRMRAYDSSGILPDMVGPMASLGCHRPPPYFEHHSA